MLVSRGEEKAVGTVKRVLKYDGVYHVHRSDWRRSAASGPIEPVIQSRTILVRLQSLMCGNQQLWFLIGVKTQFLSH